MPSIIASLNPGEDGRIVAVSSVTTNPAVGPDTFEQSITDGTLDAPFEVDALPPGGFYRIRVYRGINIVASRTVILPSGDVIEWAALLDIDPDTFESTISPPPAWTAIVDDLQQQINDIDTGAVNDLGREFVQASPAASWSIPFPAGLNRRPNVRVYDDAGNIIGVDVVADLLNRVVSISFPLPLAGSAVLT